MFRFGGTRGKQKPWYKCAIRGENFPAEMVGETGLAGFYVTRFVEAPDPETAENLAVQSLKVDPNLALPAGQKPSELARVYVEEITEISASEVPKNAPGFTWFLEKGD